MDYPELLDTCCNTQILMTDEMAKSVERVTRENSFVQICGISIEPAE